MRWQDGLKYFTPVDKSSPLFWWFTRWAANFCSDLNQLAKKNNCLVSDLTIYCHEYLFEMSLYESRLLNVQNLISIPETLTDRWDSAYIFFSDCVALDHTKRFPWKAYLNNEPLVNNMARTGGHETEI